MKRIAKRIALVYGFGNFCLCAALYLAASRTCLALDSEKELQTCLRLHLRFVMVLVNPVPFRSMFVGYYACLSWIESFFFMHDVYELKKDAKRRTQKSF